MILAARSPPEQPPDKESCTGPSQTDFGGRLRQVAVHEVTGSDASARAMLPIGVAGVCARSHRTPSPKNRWHLRRPAP
jgi:hypothetical protein